MCLILGLLASNFVIPLSLAAEKSGQATATAPLGEKAPSSVEARLRANKYSFNNAGIGVMIAFGKGNKSTADAIGSAFVKEIEKRGEKARYFYYDANWDGAAIEYYIGYSALGPWDTQTAAGNISKAVARMKAAKNVHGD